MTRYAFVQWFRPSVEQNLFVDRELADHTWEREAEGFRVAIRFPHSGEEWWEHTAAAYLGKDEDPFLGVRLLEVTAYFESEGLEADDARRVELLKMAYRITGEVTLRFRAWLRVKQPWLGLADTPLERVGPSRFLNIDTGQRLSGYGEEGLVAIHEPQVVTQAELESVPTDDAEPPIPESLLADAKFLGVLRRPPDRPRAILAAAIACEAKVKQVLRKKVSRDAQALLEFLLTNPRAFPHSAIELFHPIAKAVVGRSLHEEDSGLYKRLNARSTLVRRRRDVHLLVLRVDFDR